MMSDEQYQEEPRDEREELQDEERGNEQGEKERPTSSDQEIEPAELARRCADLILEKKGRDIAILDIGKLTDMADYFVLCSCDNDVHVKAVAENIRDMLGRDDIRPWRTEGWQGLSWIIMDYVEVVVHVFYREARQFYKLERLWADAEIEYVTDGPLVSDRTEEEGSGESSLPETPPEEYRHDEDEKGW